CGNREYGTRRSHWAAYFWLDTARPGGEPRCATGSRGRSLAAAGTKLGVSEGRSEGRRFATCGLCAAGPCCRRDATLDGDCPAACAAKGCGCGQQFQRLRIPGRKTASSQDDAD